MKKLLNLIILISLCSFGHFAVAKDDKKNKESEKLYNLKRGVVAINNNIIKSAHSKPGNIIGSGFIIDKKLGMIVTNNHVASTNTLSEIKVTFVNGKEINAKAIYSDPTIDFSFLKVEPADIPEDAAQLDLSVQDPKVDTDIIIISNNQGQNYSVQDGRINSLYSNVGLYPAQIMTISVNVKGGSSGSAVLDKKNKVLGLVFAGDDTFVNAIPVQYLRDAFAKIKEGKKPERMDTGSLAYFNNLHELIKHDNFPKDVADNYLKNNPQYKNFVLYIGRNIIETPAAKVFKPGDVIWSINDIEIGANLYLMQKIINETKEDLRFSIYRNGIKQDVTVATYNLHDTSFKRMLHFGGAVFYEADEATRLLNGASIGDIVAIQIDNGSAFDVVPALYFDNFGYAHCIKLLSYQGKNISSFNAFLELLPELIKKKFFSLDYVNLMTYQGYSYIPRSIHAHMRAFIEYHNYTEPLLLEYNEKTLEWEKKDIKY